MYKILFKMKNIKLYNEDNLEVMERLPNESIDVVCIDPPYLYLKGQKLERPFDEQLFFTECKRLLTKDGFIVMFGRGTSFYRWNTILHDLGFTFKEELIWDKRMPSNPLNSILRVHETISVFTKGKGIINKLRIPFQEAFKFDLDKVVKNINRAISSLGNECFFNEIKNYLETGNIHNNTSSLRHNNVSVSSELKTSGQAVNSIKILKEGAVEKSIFPIVHQSNFKSARIHPTQKPVRLLERLLALVIPKDKEAKDIVVADWFGGSFSTMEAVYNMGMQGISTEIDREYFDLGKERIEKLTEGNNQLKMVT